MKQLHVCIDDRPGGNNTSKKGMHGRSSNRWLRGDRAKIVERRSASSENTFKNEFDLEGHLCTKARALFARIIKIAHDFVTFFPQFGLSLPTSSS